MKTQPNISSYPYYFLPHHPTSVNLSSGLPYPLQHQNQCLRRSTCCSLSKIYTFLEPLPMFSSEPCKICFYWAPTSFSFSRSTQIFTCFPLHCKYEISLICQNISLVFVLNNYPGLWYLWDFFVTPDFVLMLPLEPNRGWTFLCWVLETYFVCVDHDPVYVKANCSMFFSERM